VSAALESHAIVRPMVDLDPQLLLPESLPGIGLRRLSRAEYLRMVEVGLFDEEERLELLRGVIVAMTPPDPPHSFATANLTELLVEALRRRARIRVQDPFAASDESMPQPDLAVVPRDDDSSRHPSQAYLVIEVSDSSLAKDRRIKTPIYASAGIPEYWIVNLVDQAIEVYTQPRADGTYAARAIVGRGGKLSPVQFPDIVIAVDDVLPRAR
jgi:Uma2 family endonuclease